MPNPARRSHHRRGGSPSPGRARGRLHRRASWVRQRGCREPRWPAAWRRRLGAAGRWSAPRRAWAASSDSTAASVRGLHRLGDDRGGAGSFHAVEDVGGVLGLHRFIGLDQRGHALVALGVHRGEEALRPPFSTLLSSPICSCRRDSAAAAACSRVSRPASRASSSSRRYWRLRRTRISCEERPISSAA